MEYQWSFRVVWMYKEALLNGLAVTLVLTFLSIIFGTVLGMVVFLLRRTQAGLLRWLVIVYIELLRAIPLLVLLVWIYYCLPILTGIRLSAFSAALLGLSLNLSAFIAETVRAGIEALPAGYIEAARSLGLTGWETYQRIILPQVLRDLLPAIMGLYIGLLKLSSLASVIAVVELLHAGNDVIATTFRPLEVYSAVAVLYVVVVLLWVVLASRLETGVLVSAVRGKVRSLHRDSTGAGHG